MYKKERTDLGYLPSEGEHLSAYVNRLISVLQQNRFAYMPPHENWRTHTQPAPCFICNFADIADYLASILNDFVKNDKKQTWRCYRPDASHDPMSFSFQPSPKK